MEEITFGLCEHHAIHNVRHFRFADQLHVSGCCRGQHRQPVDEYGVHNFRLIGRSIGSGHSSSSNVGRYRVIGNGGSAAVERMTDRNACG